MISIIVVIGKNRAIGYKNKLLWELPEDMKRFKKLTTNHTVVMGDQTFLSIGRPLPNRNNIVLSLDKNFKAPGCEVKHSVDDVLEEYKGRDEEIFIIGGGKIYELFIPWADKLYLTVIEDEPEADTFFPDYSEFKKVLYTEEGSDSGHIYKFLELEK